METFFALLAICAGNSPVNGEFPTQRPVTWSLGVFFYLSRNECLNKLSWGWWFETPSRQLWRHGNVSWIIQHSVYFTFVKMYAYIYIVQYWFPTPIQSNIVVCINSYRIRNGKFNETFWSSMEFHGIPWNSINLIFKKKHISQFCWWYLTDDYMLFG